MFELVRTDSTPQKCDTDCEFGMYIGENECFKQAEWVIIENSVEYNDFHWMHVCESHAVEALEKAEKDLPK